MKALCWHGKHDMRCETVPDPRIEHPRDAIIKVTSCDICGSDLHMYDGLNPSMKSGDVVGHETMGEVVEVGSGTGNSRWATASWFLHDFLRRVLLLQARFLFRLRALQSQRQGYRKAMGPLPGRPLWLFAQSGRLRRRPGRISKRAVRRCGANESRRASNRYHA